jgi:hypothetical protein
MGTTQSAVAGLESDRSSPRVATVERAVRACGQELMLSAHKSASSIDETLVASMLRIPQEHRLRASPAAMRTCELAHAAARARGELADFNLRLCSGGTSDGVDFVIVGGMAMVLRSSARLTRDLDICYSATPPA